MDHERCSQLLRPYVEGELETDTRAEVEGHLSTCAECRLEEAGVRAIRSTQPEPLTDLERGRLHRELRARVDLPEPSSDARAAWLAPALAVAAVLVAVVVGAQLSGERGGDGDAATGGAGRATDLAGPRPRTVRLVSEGAVQGLAADTAHKEGPVSGGAESAPAGEGESAVPRSAEIERDERRESLAVGNVADASRRLTRFARRSDAFTSLTSAYSVRDVSDLQQDFLAQLVADAPNGSAGKQVVDCAGVILEAQSYPMLPAVAGHGRFEQRKALLLGFVWSREDQGPLDRYWLFVWPRGSCEIPLHSQTGRLPR